MKPEKIQKLIAEQVEEKLLEYEMTYPDFTNGDEATNGTEYSVDDIIEEEPCPPVDTTPLVGAMGQLSDVISCVASYVEQIDAPQAKEQPGVDENGEVDWDEGIAPLLDFIDNGNENADQKALTKLIRQLGSSSYKKRRKALRDLNEKLEDHLNAPNTQPQKFKLLIELLIHHLATTDNLEVRNGTLKILDRYRKKLSGGFNWALLRALKKIIEQTVINQFKGIHSQHFRFSGQLGSQKNSVKQHTKPGTQKVVTKALDNLQKHQKELEQLSLKTIWIFNKGFKHYQGWLNIPDWKEWFKATSKLYRRLLARQRELEQLKKSAEKNMQRFRQNYQQALKSAK